MPYSNEWLDFNSRRAYPIVEDATRTSSDPTQVIIPNDLILDIAVIVPNTTPLPLYLASVSNSGILLSFLVADSSGSTIAYTTINTSSFVEETGYELTPIVNGVGGTITLGSGVNTVLSQWSRGNHTFSVAGTELEPSTYFLMQYGPVTSIGVLNDPTVLRGDVKLKAGSNAKLMYNFSNNSIVVMTTAGDQLAPACKGSCDENNCAENILKTINGVRPSASCDFTIEGRGLVEVVTDYSIRLRSHLGPADLDPNATKASDGRPGLPGAPGPQGPAGICIECDCFESAAACLARQGIDGCSDLSLPPTVLP